MRVIIIGCGRLGSALAGELSQKGHQVTIIDQNEAAFDHLPIDFRGQLIKGDAMTRSVLLRAGIERADALAAVTNSDSLNALLAYIARTQYKIGQVAAGNYDPRMLPLQQSFGVPVISSAGLGAARLEELILPEGGA